LLLIEDDPGVRAVVNLVLTGCGFRMLSAENGTIGLDLYRQHQALIAAVLTDLMMPGIQGGDVIRELREINPAVRIVAMSGVLVAGSDLTQEPGQLAFMAKPMSADDLIRALQSLGVGS
jgi:CheY-like chemotaxis protein